METGVDNRMKINLLVNINRMLTFYTFALQEGFATRVTITFIL